LISKVGRTWFREFQYVPLVEDTDFRSTGYYVPTSLGSLLATRRTVDLLRDVRSITLNQRFVKVVNVVTGTFDVHQGRQGLCCLLIMSFGDGETQSVTGRHALVSLLKRGA
jgi:hypothetical protein